MSFTQQIINLARAYAAHVAVPLTTVSKRAFAESKLLDKVADGRASMTLSRAEQGVVWFAAHWPDGLEWPDGIARPTEPDKQEA
jgi:hypothetical protein